MADIVHKISVNSPAETVYNAIATVDGLKGWWTENVEGESEEGKQLSFNFPETDPVMDIMELIPHEIIKWKCADSVKEWKDTILTFELEEKDGVTELLFAQSGWEDQSEFFAHCNTKWAVFMLSLKHLCEDGKGEPFPSDTQI